MLMGVKSKEDQVQNFKFTDHAMQLLYMIMYEFLQDRHSANDCLAP